MFCEPKNFIRCSGTLRPHMDGSKTDHFTKTSQNCKKKPNFYIERNVFQMCSKCKIFVFFYSKGTKRQNWSSILRCELFFVNHLTHIWFLSEYLSYGTKAILEKFWFPHFLTWWSNDLHLSCLLRVCDVQKVSFSSKKHSQCIYELKTCIEPIIFQRTRRIEFFSKTALTWGLSLLCFKQKKFEKSKKCENSTELNFFSRCLLNMLTIWKMLEIYQRTNSNVKSIRLFTDFLIDGRRIGQFRETRMYDWVIALW